MMAGDVENAMICRGAYCAGIFWTNGSNLVSVSNHYVRCIKEAAKYQQNTILYNAMTSFNALLYLSGTTNGDDDVDIKSYDELDEIG
eukprot:CAMPEP_0172302158 /NCGR_PEP_ID=MMETSP1058-20130122/3906_1 /TAXON_ID=83371 /ORGANISM="Detonula confervacea, Strain CCMP 353" /LENGTH=86 /DNA_ID=CAMNT_0013012537 /DNA_START=1 /DNA_END=258 /DNA_ORIENTATION=+